MWSGSVRCARRTLSVEQQMTLRAGWLARITGSKRLHIPAPSDLCSKKPAAVVTRIDPTDAAFAKVPKSTLAALGKNKAMLRSVLLYHVVKGNVTAAKVVKLRSAKTLNGQAVPIRVAGRNVFVGGARVTTADVKASNGVIHVVNKVLIP